MSDIKRYEPLWGAWYVDSLIGEGSYGKVYKVHREEFGRTSHAAVKMISIPQSETDLRQMRAEGLDDASARSYFQAFVADIVQEVHLLSEFRGNSHVVSLEDYKVMERPGEIGWDILIRMELLQSLADRALEKPLAPKDVVTLGMHICRALELCARKGIIHRDIKPDNVFISQYGDYKLGDFGIARQVERTMSGLSKKGTYTYMAPEVFQGLAYGATVDIYSLGIMMYRFLNRNRTPFLPSYPLPITPADRDRALQRRMSGEELPPLGEVDPALDAAVRRACAYDSGERFESPMQMREALERVADGNGRAVPAAVAVDVAADLTDGTVEVFSQRVPSSADDGGEEATAATVGVFERRSDGEAQSDDGAATPVDEPKKSGKTREKIAYFVIACVLMIMVFKTILTVTPGQVLETAEASSKGFGGPVQCKITVDSENTLLTVTFGGDLFAETEGFGTKILDGAFATQFIGRVLPLQNDDIDLIAGATISSDAAVEAVNKAYRKILDARSVESMDTSDMKISSASSKGFGGPVQCEITVDANSILQTVIFGGDLFAETEGLGTKILEDEFIEQFINKALPLVDGSIDLIAGATVSSEAAVNAVNKAYDKLLEQ